MKRVWIILFIILIAAALLFVVGSDSLRQAAADMFSPLFSGGKIVLNGEKIPLSSRHITTVISRWDLEQLDRFTRLESADLRGSSCYQEIAAWAEHHPNVEVVYSVPLPNGQSADSNAESLDLSWMNAEQVTDTMEALRWIPSLREVSLGEVGTERLPLNDFLRVHDKRPELKLHFTAILCGRPVDNSAAELDLSGISHEEVKAAALTVAQMPNLRGVELGAEGQGSVAWEDIALLKASRPDVDFHYRFTLYGQELDLDQEHLDFRGTPVHDNGAALYPVLACMNRCKTLDMDSTGVSSHDLAVIRDLFPNIKVVWRVWFGTNYSVRTDTERIFASKPTVGGMISDPTELMYCTEVRYLDLGHNDEMPNINFAAYMPDLEVCIIAMTGVTDLSPLTNCSKLEYLEINSTDIADLSPLAGHTALRHVNIACCPNLRDISPLYGCTELERLWIGRETPVPSDQVAAMRAAAPGCKVNVTTEDPHGESWRFTGYDPEIPLYYWVPRYKLLREQLGYNYQDYSFYWLDPLCELEAPPEFKGKYGRGVYGYA